MENLPSIQAPFEAWMREKNIILPGKPKDLATFLLQGQVEGLTTEQYAHWCNHVYEEFSPDVVETAAKLSLPPREEEVKVLKAQAEIAESLNGKYLKWARQALKGK